MGRIGRWAALAVMAGLLLWPLACSQHHPPPVAPANGPLVRVRLLAGRDVVSLRATAPPTVKAASEKSPLRLKLPLQLDISLALVQGRWHIGSATVPGSGELALWQAEDASVAVNGHTYHGRFRFVPTGDNAFDVVNDVHIDNYLKSVVARDALSMERRSARGAGDCRTDLCFVRSAYRRRHRTWDLYSDQRSQVYGGVESETSKSRAAVEDTAGIVVAYGAAGRERIFKAYFSACCGGVTQSSADAFNMPFLVPLCDQNVHGLCSAADKYNWGPVEIRKDELTRRLRAYTARHDPANRKWR